MKGRVKIIMTILMIALLAPGWLYASGNLPSVFIPNECIIRAINDCWPDLAGATFQKSHRAFEKLRNVGINVPCSYNERLVRIAEIRGQVIRICNQIIKGERRCFSKRES
jgi:hypothetical protein